MKEFVFFLMNTCLFWAQGNGEDIILQTSDSIKVHSYQSKYSDYSLSLKNIVVPTALITYGLIGIESDELKFYNGEIKEEINEHIDEKFTMDDGIQYLPMASIYGLDLLGVKSRHSFKEKTIILGTAFILMSTTTIALKKLMHIQRPDGSSYNSFPSGHTATAFMGAELLHQEYKYRSPWYGISGYVVAAGVGYFRMHNDRHWFTDVVAGAGIGMLSTKFAYWLYPRIQNIFRKSENTSVNGLLYPMMVENHMGLGLVLNF